jgi:hypothetical protein
LIYHVRKLKKINFFGCNHIGPNIVIESKEKMKHHCPCAYVFFHPLCSWKIELKGGFIFFFIFIIYLFIHSYLLMIKRKYPYLFIDKKGKPVYHFLSFYYMILWMVGPFSLIRFVTTLFFITSLIKNKNVFLFQFFENWNNP